MNLTDRTGQVWMDRSYDPDGEMILIVGSPRYDEDGDVAHPSIVLCSDDFSPGERTDWFESYRSGEWEFSADMKRLF